MTGVSDIIKEECHTTMLHGDMTLSRIMVYARSIEEPNPGRRNRDAKRRRTDEHVQTKFKKRALIIDDSSAPKVYFERGGGSQMVQPTCSTCGKNHFRKCLASTSGCFGCAKDDHKVRDCPTIATRGREAKKVPSNALDGGSPYRNHFYDLQSKGVISGDDAGVF